MKTFCFGHLYQKLRQGKLVAPMSVQLDGFAPFSDDPGVMIKEVPTTLIKDAMVKLNIMAHNFCHPFLYLEMDYYTSLYAD